MGNNICIACKSELKFLGETGGFSVFKCPECGLGVTRGNQSRGQYHAYHRDETYIAAKEQFQNIFERRVNILQEFKDSGSVLEVGSSTGLLLSLLAKRGWKVYGVEPSKTAVHAAMARKVPTINSTFEEADIPPARFDVVLFNHVLEHLANPLATLRKVREVLKKDGIVLIDLPNFGSLSAKFAGIRWGYAAPEEHLWHFTKDSLFLILKKSGFAPIHWEARSGVWDYGNPVQEVWQSLLGGKKRFFKNVLTLLPAFIITKLKIGTSLTVVAQKI